MSGGKFFESEYCNREWLALSRELKRFTTFVWELSVIWNNEIKATKILIVINMIIIMLMMIMMVSSKKFLTILKLRKPPWNDKIVIENMMSVRCTSQTQRICLLIYSGIYMWQSKTTSSNDIEYIIIQTISE